MKNGREENRKNHQINSYKKKKRKNLGRSEDKIHSRPAAVQPGAEYTTICHPSSTLKELWTGRLPPFLRPQHRSSFCDFCKFAVLTGLHTSSFPPSIKSKIHAFFPNRSLIIMDVNRKEENNRGVKAGEEVVVEGNTEESELEGNGIMEVDGNTGQLKDSEVLEPCVGMEFESEDAARKFYIEYARKLGFVVRIMQRRRSEIDGRTLARRLGCNKQGFSPNNKVAVAPDKKPRSGAREGCKATILVKMEKSGKWVVTRFVKDHNHPLIVSTRGVRNGVRFLTNVDKDKKIDQLTLELQRQDQLCAAYRKKLLNFLASVEEQGELLSSKINGVIENMKTIEAEIQKFSHH